jgi:hypothetical protein
MVLHFLFEWWWLFSCSLLSVFLLWAPQTKSEWSKAAKFGMGIVLLVAAFAGLFLKGLTGKGVDDYIGAVIVERVCATFDPFGLCKIRLKETNDTNNNLSSPTLPLPTLTPPPTTTPAPPTPAEAADSGLYLECNPIFRIESPSDGKFTVVEIDSDRDKLSALKRKTYISYQGYNYTAKTISFPLRCSVTNYGARVYVNSSINVWITLWGYPADRSIEQKLIVASKKMWSIPIARLVPNVLDNYVFYFDNVSQWVATIDFTSGAIIHNVGDDESHVVKLTSPMLQEPLTLWPQRPTAP